MGSIGMEEEIIKTPAGLLGIVILIILVIFLVKWLK
jgi:hypothetical protein